MTSPNRTRTVVVLGTAQTLAWASSYYLPAILAVPIARDLRLAVPTVYAAFSAALLVSAAAGPLAGRAIDRFGGRPVLMATSALFAAGLSALGASSGAVSMFAAWALLGVAMGAGLYEAAFASLVRLYGHDARRAITGITLFAGFASTVGWPLSTFLDAQLGWRAACVVWAVLHLVVGLPLNALVPRIARGAPHDVAGSLAAPPPGERAAASAASSTVAAPSPLSGAETRRAGALLAFMFAATLFLSTAMAAHLPRVLQLGGATLAAAVLVGALIGPAQVAARALEFVVLRRVPSIVVARIAAALHPLGALLFLAFGAPAALAFGVLHGAGNGLLTIVKGTLSLALFGPAGYGRRQGLLMVPARIAQALSPWLFGLCLDRWGDAALGVTAACGALAVVALLLLPDPARRAQARIVGTAASPP